MKFVPDTLEDEDVLEMVNAGLVKITIVDDHLANFWKQIFPGMTVHADAAVRTGGEIAMAVRKGSPQLKAQLDAFVKAHGQGTAFGNVTLRKYLQNVRYAKSATSDAEIAKFNRIVEFFQKYGDQYDVDWLLMAAQGYQESGLDQTVHSKVGAIGVMQVMPATGKDMKVGDISQLEPNIHAGVKYIRFMGSAGPCHNDQDLEQRFQRTEGDDEDGGALDEQDCCSRRLDEEFLHFSPRGRFARCSGNQRDRSRCQPAPESAPRADSGGSSSARTDAIRLSAPCVEF